MCGANNDIDVTEVTGTAGADGSFISWETNGAVPPAGLDPPVRGLVAALNQTGWVRTVFSCGGHPEESDSIRRGRRQAHVDLLVADQKRWRILTHRYRRDVQAAVRLLDLVGRPRIRWADGSLGPPPDWLRAAAAREAPVSEDTEPPLALARPAPGSVWRRLRTLLDVTRRHRQPVEHPRGEQPVQWRYRRLVLEPVPYAMPPDVCRQVLDAALAATERAVRNQQ